jgi:hypothetical protein
MRCFDVNLHNKKLDLEWICDKNVTKSKSNKTVSAWTPNTQTNKEDFNPNKTMHATTQNVHKSTDLEALTLQGDDTKATRHTFNPLFSTETSAGVRCWDRLNNKDSQLLSMCVFVSTAHLALATLLLPQYSTSHAEFYYLTVICCYPISIMFTKNSTTQVLTCCLHVLSLYEYIRQSGTILKLSTAVYILYISFLLSALLLRLNRNISTNSKIICITLYVGGVFAVLGLWFFRQNADTLKHNFKEPSSLNNTIDVNLLSDITASITVLLIANCDSLL